MENELFLERHNRFRLTSCVPGKLRPCGIVCVGMVL